MVLVCHTPKPDIKDEIVVMMVSMIMIQFCLFICEEVKWSRTGWSPVEWVKQG